MLARLEAQAPSSPRPVSATGYVVKFPPQSLPARPQTAATSRAGKKKREGRCVLISFKMYRKQ